MPEKREKFTLQCLLYLSREVGFVSVAARGG